MVVRVGFYLLLWLLITGNKKNAGTQRVKGVEAPLMCKKMNFLNQEFLARTTDISIRLFPEEQKIFHRVPSLFMKNKNTRNCFPEIK